MGATRKIRGGAAPAFKNAKPANLNNLSKEDARNFIRGVCIKDLPNYLALIKKEKGCGNKGCPSPPTPQQRQWESVELEFKRQCATAERLRLVKPIPNTADLDPSYIKTTADRLIGDTQIPTPVVTPSYASVVKGNTTAKAAANATAKAATNKAATNKAAANKAALNAKAKAAANATAKATANKAALNAKAKAAANAAAKAATAKAADAKAADAKAADAKAAANKAAANKAALNAKAKAVANAAAKTVTPIPKSLSAVEKYIAAPPSATPKPVNIATTATGPAALSYLKKPSTLESSIASITKNLQAAKQALNTMTQRGGATRRRLR